MDDEEYFEGIGGWLILIAFGIVVTPLLQVMYMLTIYSALFSTGAWEVLTTQGSEAYSPLWAPIISGEILIGGTILLALLYMAYLFFTKKKAFPKWYIGVAFFNLVFVIGDAFATKLVLPDAPVFDPFTVKELMRSLFMVIVWVQEFMAVLST